MVLGIGNRRVTHEINVLVSEGRIVEEVHRRELNASTGESRRQLFSPMLSRFLHGEFGTLTAGQETDHTSLACSSTCGKSCNTRFSWPCALASTKVIAPMPLPTSQTLLP